MIKKGNEIIKVTIYDTAGQERFNYLIKNYYKGTNGVLLIFDITNRDSFNKIDFWLQDLRDNADNIDNIFIYLIGNKIDLEEKRQVSFEEANEYANKKNMKYLEVSAKTGQNIKKLFEEMIKGSILNIIKKGNMNNPSNPTIRLSFLDKEEQPVKNERCC
jgi:small GTP-binding protein